MFYGFIKVAALTPVVRVADTAHNTTEIVNLAGMAAKMGVKLAVFPELSVTGATCGDLFLQKTLIDAASSALLHIAAETSELDCVIVVGAPVRRENKLYNCAVIMYRGEILGIVPKRTVSARSELGEGRVFSPAPEKCGTCELFGISYPFGADMLFYAECLHDFNFACEFERELYTTEPISSCHARAGATVICSLGACYELVGREERRRDFIRTQSSRLYCAYIYSGAGMGESTTDGVFGGCRMICEMGEMLSESNAFSQDKIAVSDIDVSKLASERMKDDTFTEIAVNADNYYCISFDMTAEQTILTRSFRALPFVPDNCEMLSERCGQILDIQAHGLAKRISYVNAACAVIGVSGGLDSCLALLAAVKAMDILKRPRTDVIAVTMPCFGTTDRTRTNAFNLCERLGVELRCIDIRSSVLQHFKDIGHDESIHNVVYENAQARERTQVIMDIANSEFGLAVGTGDLSELALGWSTYNGDHMSMYGVNSSVPKTLIRHIISYYAQMCGDSELSGVLLDILDTPVSPELLPSDGSGEITQKTEDLVGPYELHDFFMYYLLRFGFSATKIEYMANCVFASKYGEKTVRKWLDVYMQRFFSQQFKRSCQPDGPKTGSVGVSPRGDLYMPSDAAGNLWIPSLHTQE